MSTLTPQTANASSSEDVLIRRVDVFSEGTRMSGMLYTPKAASAEAKLPTIVMAHGWGGTQRSLQRDAEGFARAGFLVLSFDYRGWGESDSRVVLTQPAADPTAVTFTAEVRAIREVVDPLDMGTDWLNALHFIQGETQCDTDRIGIWGSSMAGGYVIFAAAHDPRVKAVHSQVTGTVSGRQWGRSVEARKEATQRARGEIGYPEPRAKFGNLSGAPITPRFADYVPSEEILDNPDVALQMVLAENEEYGGNEAALGVYERHQGPKNLVIIDDTGHYDIYRGAWQQAHDLALAWFDKHLKR
ncbi:MAG: alpha/beta fold hydrolase [Pseudomonadales bacterium]|nr:alpha/beta fold hydrolase [Pseudomonadales bacterium]